jgi:hypothetical protein
VADNNLLDHPIHLCTSNPHPHLCMTVTYAT